ncbi:hypothetical protein DFJ77DRAFT_474050 [Powellomyces hirtus]|nr:hypothetical protein DFJ77DRAFT_474050 [Powellomyces hirtus]
MAADAPPPWLILAVMGVVFAALFICTIVAYVKRTKLEQRNKQQKEQEGGFAVHTHASALITGENAECVERGEMVKEKPIAAEQQYEQQQALDYPSSTSPTTTVLSSTSPTTAAPSSSASSSASTSSSRASKVLSPAPPRAASLEQQPSHATDNTTLTRGVKDVQLATGAWRRVRGDEISVRIGVRSGCYGNKEQVGRRRKGY